MDNKQFIPILECYDNLKLDQELWICIVNNKVLTVIDSVKEDNFASFRVTRGDNMRLLSSDSYFEVHSYNLTNLDLLFYSEINLIDIPVDNLDNIFVCDNPCIDIEDILEYFYSKENNISDENNYVNNTTDKNNYVNNTTDKNSNISYQRSFRKLH